MQIQIQLESPWWEWNKPTLNELYAHKSKIQRSETGKGKTVREK